MNCQLPCTKVYGNEWFVTGSEGEESEKATSRAMYSLMDCDGEVDESDSVDMEDVSLYDDDSDVEEDDNTPNNNNVNNNNKSLRKLAAFVDVYGRERLIDSPELMASIKKWTGIDNVEEKIKEIWESSTQIMDEAFSDDDVDDDNDPPDCDADDCYDWEEVQEGFYVARQGHLRQGEWPLRVFIYLEKRE